MKHVKPLSWRVYVCALPVLFWAGAAQAQISPTAYRVLGQTNLIYNGLNLVQGLELRSPNGIALDTRGPQVHLYIADSLNSRVLAWQDATAYQLGDAPTLILGQPGRQYSGVLGIGAKGFNSPASVAVDPTTGNLFVADLGNSRVLRYPSPFDNPGQIEPDTVYGQPNFTTFSAGVSATSMNLPRAVTVDQLGNLWVADTGNNRVLRFSANLLNNPAPVVADLVIGQKNFTGTLANAGGSVSATGLDTPAGLAVDAQNNLYIADFRNTRVLRFTAPVGSNGATPTASGVWGENDFVTRGVPQPATNSSLGGPQGITVDSKGNLYVSVPLDNRVLVFSTTNAATGSVANNVFGQSDFATTTPNTNAFPQASASTLSAPSDVKVDANGNVFIADTGNNRVIKIPAGSKSANQVWGQGDLVSDGPNQIKPSSVNFPYQTAIDYSQAPFALYVSDTGNNRVLVWRDSVRFQSGDPADLAIGQPNLRTAAANVDTGTAQTPTSTSLSGPTGIAVDPAGTLYVADSKNNRVLRFPRPVAQQGSRITPDAVIGQVSFTSTTSAAVSASSLNAPGGVAIGPNGDLFVADAGNNRVLEYQPSPGTGASAIRVYGQSTLNSSLKPSQLSAQTLTAPQAVYVDQASNLYVADSGSNRVVAFSNTITAPVSGAAATYVIGQGNFFGAAGGTGLKTPLGIGVDSSGQIYIGDSGNNRVLVFPSLIFLPQAGGVASGVVGQTNLTGVNANWDGQNGLASSDSLFGPVGIYLDRQDTLYVGDTGNNRVLQFLKRAVVVNAATFQVGNPVAPGSIATIGGSTLATATGQATGTTWPSTLSNRQVVLNDQLAAPIYFVGLSQINFQVPSNATLGSNRLAVRLADTGELVAGGSLVVGASEPGLFTASQSGTGQVAALNQNNTVNSASNPALAGSTIQLYGTGQGQVSPAVPDGTAAPSSPLSNTVAVPTSDAASCFNTQPSVCVAIGSTGFGNIQFSGLAPGYIGLWQINVTIPTGTPSGNANLRVIINGTPSNVVTIAVK
jgi:uncharacterized protein (TIGR03437 family)